jgi:hypothetical protein
VRAFLTRAVAVAFAVVVLFVIPEGDLLLSSLPLSLPLPPHPNPVISTEAVCAFCKLRSGETRFSTHTLPQPQPAFASAFAFAFLLCHPLRGPALPLPLLAILPGTENPQYRITSAQKSVSSVTIGVKPSTLPP